MTTTANPIYRSFELELVKRDIRFYCDVLPRLITKNISSIMIFGLMPYLSLFTVETYNYFQTNFPQRANIVFREHRDIITASRMRVKFFDDTEKRIDGTFELLKWITNFNKEQFIGSHKGFLAPLRRALSDDLGVFFYDDHIIGSTHVGLFNAGYEEKDFLNTSRKVSDVLKLLSKSIGVALGQYLGQLCGLPEITSDNSESVFFYNIKDEKMQYKDEKASKYFSVVFNGDKTIDLNFSLLLFLATLNFIQYLFRNVVAGTPPTLFKLKFITLYHLLSSLEKLKKYYYPTGLLSDDAKAYFREILEEKELILLKKQKALRNILVHYSIREIPETSLNISKDLFGLVEYYFNGNTYTEIDEMLNRQILRISSILEKWVNWKILPDQLSSWRTS